MKTKILICVITAILLLCAACGSEDNSEISSNAPESATSQTSGEVNSEEDPFYTLNAEVVAKLVCPEAPVSYSQDGILSATGIETAWYTGGFYYAAGDFVSAETFAAFHGKDEASAKLIEDKLESKRNELEVQNKNYNSVNYEMAKNGTVIRNGNDVFLVISPAKDEIVDIITD